MERKKLSYNELNQPIVFVIDMINGFINEGALHDKRIMNIVDPIKEVMDHLECRNVFVCDNHPPHTREFDSFPAHCLIGSHESEVIDELKPYIKRLMKKNSTNTFHCQDFLTFLEEEIDNYKDIVVMGCCTDLCVLQFVLTFQSWLNEHNKKEHRIIVPSNCVETYDIVDVHSADYWNKVALDNMAINGVCVIDSFVK